MNIEKVLIKEKKKQMDTLSANVAVLETQKLLMDKGAEDVEMLKQLGMHATVMQAIQTRDAKVEHDLLEAKYGEVYTMEQIEELCCKYALKFLNSKSYKGAIDPVMLQKIREFSEDNKISITSAHLNYSFFVMAPPAAFKLVEKDIIRKRIRPVAIDPILFYKIDDTHYRKIHKWGVDFTMFRRILGWKYTNVGTFIAFWILATALFAIPLASTLLNSLGAGSLIGLFLGAMVAWQRMAAATNSIWDFTEDWKDNYRNDKLTVA